MFACVECGSWMLPRIAESLISGVYEEICTHTHTHKHTCYILRWWTTQSQNSLEQDWRHQSDGKPLCLLAAAWWQCGGGWCGKRGKSTDSTPPFVFFWKRSNVSPIVTGFLSLDSSQIHFEFKNSNNTITKTNRNIFFHDMRLANKIKAYVDGDVCVIMYIDMCRACRKMIFQYIDIPLFVMDLQPSLNYSVFLMMYNQFIKITSFPFYNSTVTWAE